MSHVGYEELRICYSMSKAMFDCRSRLNDDSTWFGERLEENDYIALNKVGK